MDITIVKSSLISSDNTRCPITTYTLVDSTYATFSGSHIKISGNDIIVDTSGTFNYQLLYIKVATQSSPSFFYVPVDIFVCGAENIQEITPQNTIMETFDLNTGT